MNRDAAGSHSVVPDSVRQFWSCGAETGAVPSLSLLQHRPPFWPRFASPLRSTAVTARIGRLLGVAFAACFLTGLLSHYQYRPWQWLPVPATPAWGYRLSQGVHVITGIACIPLLLLKLWSVYHRLFEWPPVRGIVHGLERASVAVLVASSVLQLVTGLFNVLQFYPWPWDFVPVHYWLSWVVIGSLLLHIAVQLPSIRRGLAAPLRDTPPGPGPDGISRRGVLVAGGAAVAAVAATTVGQVVPPLERIAVLAPRRPGRGPQGLPVNKTALAAGVSAAATAPSYRLSVRGAHPFELTVAELEALPAVDTVLPIACVEGWSRSAHWRGPRLLDLVTRAGGDDRRRVTVVSLQNDGYRTSTLTGSQLRHAVLATHLSGQRLTLDHGYPVRLIAPDRAGVLQTKWITRVEITP